MDAAQLCRAILQKLNKFELDIQDLREGQTQILQRLNKEHNHNANDVIVQKKPPNVILAEGRAEKRAHSEQEPALSDSGPRLQCLTAERPRMPHRRLPTRRARNQSEPALPSWRISTHVRKQPIKNTSIEAVRKKTAQVQKAEEAKQAAAAKTSLAEKHKDEKPTTTPGPTKTIERSSPAKSASKQPTRATRQSRRSRGVSCPPKVGNRIKSIFGKLSRGGQIPLGGLVGHAGGPITPYRPQPQPEPEEESVEEDIVIEEIDASEETWTEGPTSTSPPSKKIELNEAQELESDSVIPPTTDLVPSKIDSGAEASSESDSPSEEAIKKLRAKLTKSKSPKYQSAPRKSVVGLFKSRAPSIHELTQSQEPDDAIVAELRKKMKNDTGTLTETETQQVDAQDEGEGKGELIENARNALFALKSVIEGEKKRSKANIEAAQKEADEEEESSQAIIETITVEQDGEAKMERRPSLQMLSQKRISEKKLQRVSSTDKKSPKMGEKRSSEKKLKRSLDEKKTETRRKSDKKQSDKGMGTKRVSEKKIGRMGDRKTSEKRIKRRSVKIDKKVEKRSNETKKVLTEEEELRLIDKQIEKEERELMAKMALEEDERVRLIRERLAKEEKKKQERIQRRIEQKAKNDAMSQRAIRQQQQREKDRMELLAFQKKIDQQRGRSKSVVVNPNIPRRPMRSKSHSRDNRLRAKIKAGVSMESKDKGGKSPRGRMKRKASRVNNLISFWNTDK